MARLRWVLILIALWGAIHPMFWFVSWFRENGFSLVRMADAWHANTASTGLVWDLTISAVALTFWCIIESTSARNWKGFLAIPATFCIGVSCGLPLYLALRRWEHADKPHDPA